jgi:hypothetical protein
MKAALILFLILSPLAALAQEPTSPDTAQKAVWSPDSIRSEEPNYAMDRYHDILRSNDPIMYLAFPYIAPIGERKLPLQDGEGKNGYFAEGRFGYRFVIYKGKYFSYKFMQRMRFTFDADILLRLTSDRSSPLLPSNNKFGLGLDLLLSKLSQLKEERTNLLWTTFQLHHYSNGQSDSFFIPGPVQRNNYRGGDFSTNYVRGVLNFARSISQKSVITAGAGYQVEVDLGGPLELSEELRDYYGLQRVLLSLQWMQKSKLVTVNSKNLATAEADYVKLERRRQFGVRTELEYIVDDVSKFTGSNPQRWAWHTYITYMPSVTNEVGFMAHSYIGRDYLNIRFDDIVFIGELGVYVRFR